MEKNSNSGEIKQVGRFGFIGIINTLIDFVIYNTALNYLSIAKELAKILSSTVAMTFSFFANKRNVFHDKQKAVGKQAIKFFLVTATNLYIIQVAIVHFVEDSFLVVWADAVASTIHLNGIFTPDFMSKNVPFFSAVAVGLVWNYLMYKKLVFKHA